MKNTKQVVEDAILTIAGSYDLAVIFGFLIKNSQLPEIVRIITYHMFLNKFDFRSCSVDLYTAYCIIFDYATELKENGEVIFKY